MFEFKRISNLKASVIIPCYNSRDLIKKNLPGLLETLKFKGNQIKEIILVDDASTDGSSSLVEKEFPKVKLIHHKINRGFSASVNTGARAAKGNILVLLGTDVIPEKNFLVSTLRRFNNPKVFAVSFHIIGFTWTKGYFKDGFVHHESGSPDNKLKETFWVSGSSAVFRRDYWMTLGGMDEKNFNFPYLEDLDLSYRAAKRGLINLWDPDSVVSHKHEFTPSKFPKNYIERTRERNQLIFIWKNISSPILFRKHLVGLMHRLIKHPEYLRIVIMAIMMFKVLIRARNREIKESRLSDEAIFAKYS